jgi:hypothetical protein
VVAALHARNDHLRVKLQTQPGRDSLRHPGLRLLGLAVAVEAALGLRQRCTSSFARAQLLGQLVAAFLAVELVFFAIDPVRLSEDLPGDLLVVTRGVIRRARVNLVPSTAITPTLTSPASPHNANTSVNKPASATSWRLRNSAIVE